MKQHLIPLAVLISIFAFSCKSNKLTGVYVCDHSKKKADTAIQREGYTDITTDLTCMISELEFVGNSTVKMGTNGGTVVSSYVIDKNFIRIKGSVSDILLKVQDERTLNGQGIIIGVYHKK